MVSLLLASEEDVASLNIFDTLLKQGSWGPQEKFPHGQVYSHQHKDVQLLKIKELHIFADNIDLEHSRLTNKPVQEVLVLSRHISSSNIPALTLHAIGIPGELSFRTPRFQYRAPPRGAPLREFLMASSNDGCHSLPRPTSA